VSFRAVYDSIDISNGDEREVEDVGLRPSGRMLPTVVVQSCWVDDYEQTCEEMREWMNTGDVERVIVLQWTLTKEGVWCGLEVFVHDEKCELYFRRTSQQVLHPLSIFMVVVGEE
jgi:hypothetical protein